MVGPEEADAGHPAADRLVSKEERDAGTLLLGAAEIAWREGARNAYPPKWTSDVRMSCGAAR